MSTEAPNPRIRRWWAIANSPLVLLIVSGLLIGGGSKLYSDHQEAVRDQAARRTVLSDLLVEYRQRLSALEALDAELDTYLGPGPGMAKQGSPITGEGREAFEKLAESVGRRQQEVIRGTGSYVPTSPSLANVNIQLIGSQIEDAAGIPNLHSGSIQLLGFLNSEPSLLWIFVRAYIPMMRQFYVNRHMMTVGGELPLARGGELTVEQAKRLGIAPPAPGELERIMKENDVGHARLQEAVRNAQAEH